MLGVFVTALAVVLIVTTTGAGLSSELLLVPDPAHPLAPLALGYKVRIREHGVRVELVYSNTHAFGVLRPGDVIVRADGRSVRSIVELHDIISRHKAGDVVALAVVRNGRVHDVRIKTSRT